MSVVDIAAVLGPDMTRLFDRHPEAAPQWFPHQWKPSPPRYLSFGAGPHF
ncbi:hypothetical protein AB0K89_04605 [Streptomyces cinnamoneus]